MRNQPDIHIPITTENSITITSEHIKQLAERVYALMRDTPKLDKAEIADLAYTSAADCIVNDFSSRMCERGVAGCVMLHGTTTAAADEGAADLIKAGYVSGNDSAGQALYNMLTVKLKLPHSLADKIVDATLGLIRLGEAPGVYAFDNGYGDPRTQIDGMANEIAELKARLAEAEERFDEAEGKAGQWIDVDLHKERVEAARADAVAMNKRLLGERDAAWKENARVVAECGDLAKQLEAVTRELDNNREHVLLAKISELESVLAVANERTEKAERAYADEVQECARAWDEQRIARAEADAAKAELEDWRESARVSESGGHSDEKHCTCVPLLQKTIKDLRAELAVTKVTIDVASKILGAARQMEVERGKALTRVADLEAKLARSEKHFEETTDKLMVAAGVDLADFKSDGDYGVEDMEGVIRAQVSEADRLAERSAQRDDLAKQLELMTSDANRLCDQRDAALAEVDNLNAELAKASSAAATGFVYGDKLEGTDWVAVDFDETLAEYHGFVSPVHLGSPIAPMVDRVKGWLRDGRKVCLHTARIAPHAEVRDVPAVLLVLRNWCKEHLGVVLPIVCVKHHGIKEFWDDRAIRVEANTGVDVAESLRNQIYRGAMALTSAQRHISDLQLLLKEACEDYMSDDHDESYKNRHVREFRARCIACGIELAQL